MDLHLTVRQKRRTIDKLQTEPHAQKHSGYARSQDKYLVSSRLLSRQILPKYKLSMQGKYQSQNQQVDEKKRKQSHSLYDRPKHCSANRSTKQ